MIEPIHNKIFFQRKYLSVQEEYDEGRVVGGKQNRLWICGKYLNLFGEYTESMEKTKKMLPYSSNTSRDIK